MNRDNKENFSAASLGNGSQFVDARKTGAIPRRIELNQQYLPANFQSTIDKINGGERVCVIMRGLPGSGKSYLAKALIEKTIKAADPQEHIVSADDYFVQNGRYRYDVSKLSEAHNYAQRLFCQRASKGYSPLIVDNTNKEYWEMEFYIKVASQYEYRVELMLPKTPWAWNPKQLSQRNAHSVPAEKISGMKENFQRDLTLQQIVVIMNWPLVTQPKQRNIPPFPLPVANNDAIDLMIFNDQLDINKNPTVVAQESVAPAVAAASTATSPPLTWNAFQQQQQMNDKSFESFFPWPESKQHDQKSGENNNWSPPNQIFEESWDPPVEKKEEERPKEKDASEPLPQRKQQQRQNKKHPSSSPPLNAIPHRRGCPNESREFANLRELYPNKKDSHLWDLFLKSNFNTEWCANILCDDTSDENITGNVDDLRCDCATRKGREGEDFQYSWLDESATQAKKIKEAEGKKQQTPVKSKKTKPKTNAEDLMAVKTAIEDSIRIGDAFYPEHVNKVKIWKNGPQASPSTSSTDSASITQSEASGNYHVMLPIAPELLHDLVEIFGGNSLGALDKSKKFHQPMLVRKSTAEMLFKDIMDNINSRLEEEKLQKIQDDHNLALRLHEQETVRKYPILAQGPSDSFKDIMDTEQALRDYASDTKGWQVVEKPETIACKLNKEKLYAAFTMLDKQQIDSIFEAMNKNFKETVQTLKDSLRLNSDECKAIDALIASTAKIHETNLDDGDGEDYNDDDDDEEEDNSSDPPNDDQRAEQLRAEVDRHFEEYGRMKEKSRECFARREFDTGSYYNSIASLQKQLGEEKRHDFVNMLSEIQKLSSSCMIDLHFFKLKEARIRLNTFLDAKITRLREIKKTFTELEIITGRGAHSSNGVANMKIMTVSLLQSRNLKPKTVDNNPGMLKVKIYPNSPLYDELPSQQKLEQ